MADDPDADGGYDPFAVALGLVKPGKYGTVERERRWLCDGAPDRLDGPGRLIVDLYVEGTRLRLREMRDLETGAVAYKLTRKIDDRPDARRITTLYLSQAEHRLLCALPGRIVRKVRRTVHDGGAEVAVDLFEASLAGLVLAEAEFPDDAVMAAYPGPSFAVREVTQDPRYGGGRLAFDGIPHDAVR